MQDTTVTSLVKPRYTVTREQIEQLRQIIIGLNKINEATNNPARLFVTFDHNFGVGKHIETTGPGDNNVWVGLHDGEPGHRRLNLTYWLEWLTFNYLPTLPPSKQAEFWISPDTIHPLDRL